MNNPSLSNIQNALVKYQYTYYGSPSPESCPLPPATWGQKNNNAPLVTRESRIIVESLISNWNNQNVNPFQNTQQNYGQCFSVQDYNDIISKQLSEIYNYQYNQRNNLKNYDNLGFNQDMQNNYVYGFNERTHNYWSQSDEMNYQNRYLYHKANDRMHYYDRNTMGEKFHCNTYGRMDGYYGNNMERNINFNACDQVNDYNRNNMERSVTFNAFERMDGYNRNNFERNVDYNAYDRTVGYNRNNMNERPFDHQFNGELTNGYDLNGRYENRINCYNKDYYNNYNWRMDNQNRKECNRYEWKRGYCNNYNHFNTKRPKWRNQRYKQKNGHQCSKCNKTFHNRSQMRLHERTHRTPSPIEQTDVQKSNGCDNIKKEVSSCNSFQFMNGRPSSHSTPRDLELSNEEKMFKCPHCPKSFAKSSEMSRHLNIHTPGIEYVCKVCSSVYFTETQLKFHELIHSQDNNNNKPLNAMK
ncbi:probable serine/threonine-protein kinase clkA [Cimex lectularius]|uniref:C2H2-type domain-containing protein n=1 Tax=Cimex lectularius TaxID=79782 RepID=A0A8I6SMH0_CIMLE|nr:probable serine/threonine-protein kinase clkA [Cimex lectularius]